MDVSGQPLPNNSKPKELSTQLKTDIIQFANSTLKEELKDSHKSILKKF